MDPFSEHSAAVKARTELTKIDALGGISKLTSQASLPRAALSGSRGVRMVTVGITTNSFQGAYTTAREERKEGRWKPSSTEPPPLIRRSNLRKRESVNN